MFVTSSAQDSEDSDPLSYRLDQDKVDHRPDVSCLKKTTTQVGLKSLKKKLNNRVCYLTGKFWIGVEIQNKCRDWYTEFSKLELISTRIRTEIKFTQLKC